MSWQRAVADNLKDHRPARSQCQRGHGRHDFTLTPVEVSGPCPSVPDFPSIRPDLGVSFKLPVWHWQTYDGGAGYCPADDEQARAVAAQGRWEGWFTAVALDIMAQGPPESLMIDFGANVGWYTFCAAAAGHHVLAIEGDADIAAALQVAIDANGTRDTVTVAEAWVDEDSPLWMPGPKVQFVKLDVEGMERPALEALRLLIDRQDVAYVMAELTPSFDRKAPELVRWMSDRGYSCHEIPDKDWFTHGLMPRFEAEPLRSTLYRVRLTAQRVWERHEQMVVLFARERS